MTKLTLYAPSCRLAPGPPWQPSRRSSGWPSSPSSLSTFAMPCVSPCRCLPMFVLCIEHCHQAPFYPREAVSKGLKVWHFGLVFGAFEITVFLVSPIIGASIKKIGVKVGILFINTMRFKADISASCSVKTAGNWKWNDKTSNLSHGSTLSQMMSHNVKTVI